MSVAMPATVRLTARLAVRGLYAITPDESDTQRLMAQVSAALEGGAGAVQYRNKLADAVLRAEQAHAVAALCALHAVPFIVNDHLQLALEIEGAGLHLGADDGDVVAARAALGPHRLLGVSCYASLDAAESAVRAGADHVAFGSVFTSSTKPGAVRAPLELFLAARHLGVPLVGIGGITLANLPQLLAAGADAAAIISDLFFSEDIRAQARRLAACFAGNSGAATHSMPHSNDN